VVAPREGWANQRLEHDAEDGAAQARRRPPLMMALHVFFHSVADLTPVGAESLWLAEGDEDRKPQAVTSSKSC